MEFYKACKEASKEFLSSLSLQSFEALTQKKERGEGGDLSMKADLLSEHIFADYLRGFGRIYSEESGYIGSGEATIYLDPLDGSDNFACRVPYYGVSVCLEEQNGDKKSFIMNFANGDVFYREDEPLTANLFTNEELRTPSLSCCKALGIFEKAYANPSVVSALFEKKIKFRSPGALALSIVYSRNCAFTLFVGKMRVFDIIAALHFVDDSFVYKTDETLLLSYDRRSFEEILEIVTTIKG